MIPTSPDHVWGSRLRTSSFKTQMGFALLPSHEIPHVRCLPVESPVPKDATVVREWPNLAGRLEPPAATDIVRWSIGSAPKPRVGVLVPRGDKVNSALLREMTKWMTSFARSLTQIAGVTLAAPSETPRCLILSPNGVVGRTDLPVGMRPVPERLAEFPGGIVLSMSERSFQRRKEYAEAVATIIGEG